MTDYLFKVTHTAALGDSLKKNKEKRRERNIIEALYRPI